MNNLTNKLKDAKHKYAYLVLTLNNLASDEENHETILLIEKAMDEVDRLKRSIYVREDTRKILANGRLFSEGETE